MAMRVFLGIALLAATPATAQDRELRDFCGDRPGLGTPACIVDAGHLQVELGLFDWSRDRQPDARTDSIYAGQVQLRYGIGATTELRLGWDAYGHVRERDRMSGAVARTDGIGDVTVGLKQSLANPDGSELSVALLPFASLPTGKRDVGAGDWGAGLMVPVTYALSDTLTFEFTPEVDAAVDEDGHGRHLAYVGVVGLQGKIGDKLGLTAEFEALRDHDPDGHATQTLAGVSLTYQPSDRIQLDAGANAGLNRHAPDVELYVGVSRKF